MVLLGFLWPAGMLVVGRNSRFLDLLRYSAIASPGEAWSFICSIRCVTLLFEDEAARPIARARPLPSGFFSLLVHAGAVLLLLWMSFSPAGLTIPDSVRRTMLVAPAPPPPPPPPATVAIRAAVRRVPSKFTFPTAKLSPVPPSVRESIIAEEPPELQVGSAPGGVPGGIPGGVPGGVIGGVLGDLPTFSASPAIAPAVPVAKAPAAPPAERRIQVSSEMQEAMLLVMVKPQYPAFAKRAHIHGTVRLSAIIDKDGKIAELKVVEGHPLLVDAALDAIRQWRYRPTILGGEAVEVGTQIVMHFRFEN